MDEEFWFDPQVRLVAAITLRPTGREHRGPPEGFESSIGVSHGARGEVGTGEPFVLVTLRTAEGVTYPAITNPSNARQLATLLQEAADAAEQ